MWKVRGGAKGLRIQIKHLVKQLLLQETKAVSEVAFITDGKDTHVRP